MCGKGKSCDVLGEDLRDGEVGVVIEPATAAIAKSRDVGVLAKGEEMDIVAEGVAARDFEARDDGRGVGWELGGFIKEVLPALVRVGGVHIVGVGVTEVIGVVGGEAPIETEGLSHVLGDVERSAIFNGVDGVPGVAMGFACAPLIGVGEGLVEDMDGEGGMGEGGEIGVEHLLRSVAVVEVVDASVDAPSAGGG